MAALMMGIAMTCVTITSCSVEDNPVVSEDHEELFPVIPGDVPVVGATDSYIYDAVILGGSKSRVEALITAYQKDGWTIIKKDLNEKCGGDYVFLAVKTGNLHSPDQGSYITGFMLSNTENAFYHDGRSYRRVQGYSNDFSGDLNSKAKKGKPTYLFYTKDVVGDPTKALAVTGITIDSDASKAVGRTGDKEGYNLNDGTKGTKLYMHLQTQEGMTCWKQAGSSSTECTVFGFVGPTSGVTSINIPLTFNGLKVVSCGDITDLKDLEEMNLYQGTSIDLMPRVTNCSKFKRINVINADGSVRDANTIPVGIKKLDASVFANTALETITLPDVTEVGEPFSKGTFEGCNSLKSVIFNQQATVRANAFSNIHANGCEVVYPFMLNKWDPAALTYSTGVVVKGKNSSKKGSDNVVNTVYMGWCGVEKETPELGSRLYWTLEKFEYLSGELTEAELTIDCCSDHFWQGVPELQTIVSHPWEAYSKNIIRFRTVTFKRVYEIKDEEFRGVSMSEIHFYPGLKKIGKKAFCGCSGLKSIIFHGTQEEWDAIEKDESWIDREIKVTFR